MKRPADFTPAVAGSSGLVVLVQLWLYRHYVLSGAIRELRHRYAGSAMGIIWHVITPLAQIVVYVVVFSHVLRARQAGFSTEAYTVYLCAGILPWFVFSEVVASGGTALLASEGYLKKLAIPEAVFVAQSAATSGLTMIVYAAALLLLALGAGIPPHSTWLLIPFVLCLFVSLAFGLALILATVTVFFRDVAQVVGIALQIWFWLTPIVYDAAALGPGLRALVTWNPPAAYLTAVRTLLMSAAVPDAGSWAYMAGLAIVFPILGAAVLQRLRSDLRDAL